MTDLSTYNVLNCMKKQKLYLPTRVYTKHFVVNREQTFLRCLFVCPVTLRIQTSIMCIYVHGVMKMILYLKRLLVYAIEYDSIKKLKNVIAVFHDRVEFPFGNLYVYST